MQNAPVWLQSMNLSLQDGSPVENAKALEAVKPVVGRLALLLEKISVLLLDNFILGFTVYSTLSKFQLWIM